jgi:hypothetical protein
LDVLTIKSYRLSIASVLGGGWLSAISVTVI